jgi:N-acyl-D-aspartate/D-glutamate deacylase
MGDDAWARVATAKERTAMAALLDQAMQAGAWGLSVSFYDVDKSGRPIPSRWADGAEFDALIDVIARYDRGLVELLPGLIHPDPEKSFEDLARRCGQRERRRARSCRPVCRRSPHPTSRPRSRSGSRSRRSAPCSRRAAR